MINSKNTQENTINPYYIAEEICKIIQKYPMSYSQFNFILDLVKQAVNSNTTINIPTDIKINSLSEEIIQRFPIALNEILHKN